MSFRIHAPDARTVFVAGSFNDWQPSTQLTRQGDGVWRAEIELAPGRYEYRFVVDEHWVEDPQAAEQSTNPYGGRNSVVSVS